MDRTPLAVNLASQNLIHLSIGVPKRLAPAPKRSAPPSPTLSTPTRPIPRPRGRKRYAQLILPGRAIDLGGSHFPLTEPEPEPINDSPYVNDSPNPRKRKLSAAQNVAARARARWAALDSLTASTADAGPNPAGQVVFDDSLWNNDREKEKEKENVHARAPRLDSEKPLPPQPTKLDIPDTSSPTLLTTQFSPNSITFVDSAHPSTRRAGPLSGGPHPKPPSADELDTVVRPPLQGPEPPTITTSPTHSARRQREEAAQMMIHNPRKNGEIACQRPGCTDVLKDVRALAYHLRIHDIHDRVSPPGFTCSACAGCYESRRELNMHDCERHRATSARPIKRRILRIVKTGWNCLSDPNRT